MVQSAFSNLVDNAAKYTPPEGSMQIRWWTDDEGGHFSVRDTGPGISAEHICRASRSVSIASIRAARAKPAAQAWGSPS